MTRPLRFLIYSPDSYGLGHFRRCLTIAHELCAIDPGLSVLCITGSPRADLFDYPDGFDTVKLPSLTKGAEGDYRPLASNFELGEIERLRTSLVESVLRDFKPDLLLVDHAPLGTLGELRPVLERLQETRRVTTVLGLRDIIDSPERVDREWAPFDLRRRLPDLYDQVLAYCDPRVFDTIGEYDLARLLPGRVHATGLVCRCEPRTRRAPRFDGAAREGRVLVTTGGGGDGLSIVEDAMRALRGWRGPVRVVLGPLAGAEQSARMQALARMLPDCTLFKTTRAMCRELGEADAVIAMAGYNTAYEAVRAGRVYFALPRQGPRLEQRLRAERLAGLGVATAIDPEPGRRVGSLERALSTTTAPAASFEPDFGGARRAAELLLRAVAERTPVPALGIPARAAPAGSRRAERGAP